MQREDLLVIAQRLITELIEASGLSPTTDTISFYMKHLQPYGLEKVVMALRNAIEEQNPEYPLPSIRDLTMRMTERGVYDRQRA